MGDGERQQPEAAWARMVEFWRRNEKYRVGDKVALGGVTRLTLARASDH